MLEKILNKKNGHEEDYEEKKTPEGRKGRELKVRKCDKTAGIEKAKITKKNHGKGGSKANGNVEKKLVK